MHTVYILYSSVHDKYYIGQTTDVERRLQEHNELSENSFTSKYRPWKLLVTMELTSAGAATRLERFIKAKKRKSFTRALVNDERFRNDFLEKFRD